MRICDKKYEALCDCSISVSCLSPQFNDELKLELKLELKICYRKLCAANSLFIQEKDVVRSPVINGPKSYEHSSSVLDKSLADCLLGFDFLESNKDDPIFSRMKLRTDSQNFVSLYHS